MARPKALSEEFKVIHHSGANRRLSSLIRNIELLEGMFKRQTEAGKLDPRTLFYLATHYYDAGNLEGAKTLLEHYIKVSGWAEERCEALVYIGDIFYRNEQDDNAHRAYLSAIGEYQNSPRPYIGLAKLDFAKGRYEESAGWIEKCLALPKATTTMVQRPMENSFVAYLIGAQSLANIGGKSLDTAMTYIKKALKIRPKDSDALGAFKQIDALIQNRQDIKAASRLINKFKNDKEEAKILPFIDALPYSTQDNPMILNTRHQYMEPTKWGKKSIAIYVGNGPLGIWGPWSLETGIGGSEEAVIKLSGELAMKGWDVTIFATPGDKAGWYGAKTNTYLGKTSIEGGMNGVTWKQFYEFNPKDEYDVLIAWRNPGFFDADIKARKKYLWLHDVMDKEEFLPERLEKIDKVIFVGKYHASLYEGVIPEDKWFISGNGIDPQDFIEADGKFRRTPHRMVYMSAYNRGLKLLLANWDKIKKAVPDATLDIYYGWEGYDSINANNPERMQWKADLVKMIDNCEGVTDHGRIGHKQIVEEINKADILAYPCVFNEVYCITYVKAMAGGLNVVSTDYAELVNYQKDGGTQVHYEEGKVDKLTEDYIPALIKALKTGMDKDERKRIEYNTRNNYSWEWTANGWDKEFQS